jgi:hypothetical protein
MASSWWYAQASADPSGDEESDAAPSDSDRQTTSPTELIGAISYTVCSPAPCSNPGASITVQNQALLWRSRDGSRLSGFVQWGPGQSIVEYYPLELIAGQ